MSPQMLCVLAVAAAAVAAYIGHVLSPARRARRERAQQVDAMRCLIAGRLARDPAVWIRFWYEHELDGIDVSGGGA